MSVYRASLCLGALILVGGCASAPGRYCSQTGQPAREGVAPYKGNKQCTIKKGPDGHFVKEGPYVEWYPSGKPALIGEFKDGKKVGKWVEKEESGKIISERWFETGVETVTRAAKEAKNPDPLWLNPAFVKPVSTAPFQPLRQKPQ